MSQQQEPSLPYLRSIQIQEGHHEAIKQAATMIDGLRDELGRTRDYHFSVLLGALLWGAVMGFGVGWLVFR